MRDGGGDDGGNGGGGAGTPIGQGTTIAEMLGERYNQMSVLQRALTPGAMVLGGGADAALRGSGYTYNPYGGHLEGGSDVSDTYNDYGARDDSGGSYDSFDGGSGGKFSDDSAWGGGYGY
jgi:hypothetical protein